jgi:hypothetical protein
MDCELSYFTVVEFREADESGSSVANAGVYGVPTP